jgi:hypothetical protein
MLYMVPNLISDRLCDALIFIHGDESNSGMQFDMQEDNLKWYIRFFLKSDSVGRPNFYA